MQKHIARNIRKKAEDIGRFILLIPLFAAVCSNAYCQQYSVKGTVVASGVPVRNASVTFQDNSDGKVSYSAITDSTGAFDLGGITAVLSRGRAPVSFKLEQNYPNPFSSETAISYDLEKNSAVKVTVYDVLGREVRRFTPGDQQAGVHGIIWNGRDNAGNRVAPGVYFYRLQAGGRALVRKMLFGIGTSNASVSLSGLLPSAAGKAGTPNTVSGGTVSFTVFIANTDSTSPLIVPQQFSFIRINSDTNMGLNILRLQQATVYEDSTQQVIEGFGGANTVNWQDHNFSSAEIDEAFGDAPGDLGLTIMRLRIPPDSSQFVWSVPTAKQAESLGAKVIATPWTPPTWMKTNNNIAGGYLDSLDYAAYAAHLRGFADTLANHGVPIYAVSVQNEPDAKVTYESCFWTPAEFLRFMRDYAPSVGVPVFMPESEGFNHTFSDPTLNDSLACAHTAFIGGHLYGTSPSVYTLALSKGKQVWMTEYLDQDTTWTADLSTAKQINDCMNDDMSAYVWWWTIDYWSLIDAGGRITRRGYVVSQYARFIRPGYRRIFATENPQPGVYLTAYSGNGKTVIVEINMNPYSTIQPVTLRNSGAISFTPYTTTDTKNCAQGAGINVSNGRLDTALPASSVTTFVSN